MHETQLRADTAKSRSEQTWRCDSRASRPHGQQSQRLGNEGRRQTEANGQTAPRVTWSGVWGKYFGTK